MLVTVCKICGGEFEQESLGRRKLYCSAACKRAAYREHVNAYRRKRYATDEAFRKERNACCVRGARKRAAKKKEATIQRLADEICNAEDCNEIKRILEKKLWRKS